MKGNRIITIGRQIGSGGSEIGMEVAKRLGIQCYDRQLIEMACDYGELDQDILAEAEEKRPNPFLYSVLLRVLWKPSGGWQRRSPV